MADRSVVNASRIEGLPVLGGALGLGYQVLAVAVVHEDAVNIAHHQGEGILI